MKKKFKFTLDLNKETVTELTRKQQQTIFGGASINCPEDTAPTRTCDTCDCTFPTEMWCHTYIETINGCQNFTNPTNWPETCH